MLSMFIVKDEKNVNYGVPYFFRSPQDMRRALAQSMVRNPDALIAQFPADYSVWFLGEWDELAGRMTVVQDMEHVCSMVEIHGMARAIAERQLPREGGAR